MHQNFIISAPKLQLNLEVVEREIDFHFTYFFVTESPAQIYQGVKFGSDFEEDKRSINFISKPKNHRKTKNIFKKRVKDSNKGALYRVYLKSPIRRFFDGFIFGV